MAFGIAATRCDTRNGPHDPPVFTVQKVLSSMAGQKTKLQKYSAPALEKGLDIIEYLSLTEQAPSLSELAAGIGRSKSEIFRMMIVLEERGYIRRTEGDQFTLTDKLGILGTDRSLNNRLAELANPVLTELSEKTRYSCHLSVLEEGRVLVVASTTLTTSYCLSVQTGHTSPVFGTSAGACLLAYLPPEDRQALIRSKRTPRPQSENAAFLQQVARCEADRFILMPSPEANSIHELSTPVLHAKKRGAIAALTIPFMATDEIGNRLSELADILLSKAQLLGEKIAITMPNLHLPAVR